MKGLQQTHETITWKGKESFHKKLKKNSDGVVKYSMHKENKKYFN